MKADLLWRDLKVAEVGINDSILGLGGQRLHGVLEVVVMRVFREKWVCAW